MKVQDAMTRNVTACHENDSLNYAAQLMWECDCGAIPVLDGNDVVCGMITDRDVAMAAYTQGLALQEIPVRTAMSTVVHSCAEEQGSPHSGHGWRSPGGNAGAQRSDAGPALV